MPALARIPGQMTSRQQPHRMEFASRVDFKSPQEIGPSSCHRDKACSERVRNFYYLVTRQALGVARPRGGRSVFLLLRWRLLRTMLVLSRLPNEWRPRWYQQVVNALFDQVVVACIHVSHSHQITDGRAYHLDFRPPISWLPN